MLCYCCIVYSIVYLYSIRYIELFFFCFVFLRIGETLLSSKVGKKGVGKTGVGEQGISLLTVNFFASRRITCGSI